MSPANELRTLLVVALLGSSAVARAGAFEDLKVRAADPPDEPEAALELAGELRRSGLNDEAIAVARGAFATARGREIVARLRLEIARNHIDQRDQRRALAECARLEKLSLVHHHVCNAEARLLRRRGSLALPEAEAALARNPRDYDALVAKGRALAQLGRAEEAEAALRSAIDVDSAVAHAYRVLAELYRHESRTKQAISILERARAVAPGDPDLLILLADVLPPGPAAVGALKQAVAIRPGDAEALAELGALQLAASNLPSAEEALRRALRINPQDADSQALMGRLLLRQGKPDAALASARAALGVVQNHPGAKLVEAIALAQKGDIDLAIEAFEIAHGLSRLDPEPLVEAAEACLAHDRPTTARAFAERATQDFPEWGPGWVALGDVAAGFGERKTARESYEKALAAKGPVDRAVVRRKLAELR